MFKAKIHISVLASTVGGNSEFRSSWLMRHYLNTNTQIAAILI